MIFAGPSMNMEELHHPQSICIYDSLSPYMAAFRVFLLCLLTVTFVAAVAYSMTSDGQALLALKSATESTTELGPFSDWDEHDVTPCHWTGISCFNVSSSLVNPRVVGIALGGKSLSGYIPSELGSLLFLRHVNLRNNRLSGQIPPELFNASSLRRVFLDGNNLSGSLPPSICSPPRLQIVDLSNNILSGPLPRNLKKCKQLQRLALSNNFFAGQIPAGLWPGLDSLIELDLSSNQLNGFIPDDIGELGNLSGKLNLSFNHLSGQIPTSLAMLPATVIIDLKGNNLSGEIPTKGSFSNQSISVGNPLLCSIPQLHQPCGGNSSSSRSDKEPSKMFIVLISAAEAGVVSLVGLVIVYLYWRKQNDFSATNLCTSFRCFDAGDSEQRRKAGDQGSELVTLDEGFKIELNELLMSSAYLLGKSRLGIVYKITLGSGEPAVVRRIGGGDGGGGGGRNTVRRCREFVRMAKEIAKVKHPNIVKLKACYWSSGEKLLVSDYISNGNLAMALGGTNGRASPRQSWSTVLSIAKGIARGLAYLHECSARRYVHGNIKQTNILLDKEWQPYISDFGVDRLIMSTGGGEVSSSLDFMAGQQPGHLPQPFLPLRGNHYRAPEVSWPSGAATQKSDVYSFGVVLLEILTGVSTDRSPERSTSMEAGDLVTWVRKRIEEKNPISDIVDPVLLCDLNPKKEMLPLFHIAMACTEADPELRPRMKTVSENLSRIENFMVTSTCSEEQK